MFGWESERERARDKMKSRRVQERGELHTVPSSSLCLCLRHLSPGSVVNPDPDSCFPDAACPTHTLARVSTLASAGASDARRQSRRLLHALLPLSCAALSFAPALHTF